MPTVVDSLIVTLGLDPSEFEKGQKAAAAAFLKTRDAAVKSGDDIEKSSKRAADGFDRVTKSALGLFAILVGTSSVAEFVTGITQADAAVGRLSSNVGLSARNLQAWQAAFQRVGGTAEGASATASTANGQLMNARINGGALPQTIARLFASAGMGTTAGRDIASGDTQQYMLDLAQAYRVTAQKQGTSTAAYLLQQGGFDPSFGNLALQHGGVGMQPYLNAMPTVSDATIAQMQETQGKFAAIQQELVTDGADLVGKVERGLSPLIDELEGQVSNLNGAIGPAASDIQKIAVAFNQLANSMGDFFQKSGLPPLNSTDVGGDLRKNINRSWSDLVTDIQSTAAGNGNTGVSFGPGMRAGTNGRPSAVQGSAAQVPDSSRASILRQIAIASGIDPDVFLRVAASEGLSNPVGDQGSSFGDFQLHYGSVSSAYPNSGLGDLFTQQTGLNARDQSTWRQQAQWVANYVRQHGWGDWSGARASGITGFAGVGQLPWFAGLASMSKNAGWAALMGNNGRSASGGDIHVHGDINVKTMANDARGIANDIVPALKRTALAQHANYGPA